MLCGNGVSSNRRNCRRNSQLTSKDFFFPLKLRLRRYVTTCDDEESALWPLSCPLYVVRALLKL